MVREGLGQRAKGRSISLTDLKTRRTKRQSRSDTGKSELSIEARGWLESHRRQRDLESGRV